MTPFQISAQSLQTISGRRHQILKAGGRIQHITRCTGEHPGRCLKGECEGYVTGRLAGDGNAYRLEMALYRAGRAQPVVARSTQTDERRIGSALLGALDEMGRGLERTCGIGGPSGARPCVVWSGDANAVIAAQKADKTWLEEGDWAPAAIALARQAMELDPRNPTTYGRMAAILGGDRKTA